MDSVPPRKGCDYYVPSVRTEASNRRANEDRCQPREPVHDDLHEPFAHVPFVLDDKRGPELREHIGPRIVERPEIDSRSTIDSASTFVSAS